MARSPPWRRSTVAPEPPGSSENASRASPSTTYQAPSAISSSSWPSPHPAVAGEDPQPGELGDHHLGRGVEVDQPERADDPAYAERLGVVAGHGDQPERRVERDRAALEQHAGRGEVGLPGRQDDGDLDLERAG